MDLHEYIERDKSNKTCIICYEECYELNRYFQKYKIKKNCKCVYDVHVLCLSTYLTHKNTCLTCDSNIEIKEVAWFKPKRVAIVHKFVSYINMDNIRYVCLFFIYFNVINVALRTIVNFCVESLLD